MKFLPLTLAVAFGAVASLRAGDAPTLSLTLPDVQTTHTSSVPVIDLRQHFAVTGVTGQVVRLSTTAGTFHVDTFGVAAPITVSNFLKYVNSGRYVNSFIHRSVKNFVIQGGGYAIPSFTAISNDAPIQLEYRLPNERGTLSMARMDNPNSATSQWFINTVNNTTSLGPINGGGYAVFARVIGAGMTVVDRIAALPVYQFQSPFNELPLTNYTGSTVQSENTISVSAAEVLPVFPATAEGQAWVRFTVTNSNPTIALAYLEGSQLHVSPVANKGGHADITVTATDADGNTARDTFHVRVAAADGSAGWYNHRIFGWIWDAGGDWYGSNGYGWMWFHPGGEWIYSSGLKGWIADTNPNSRTLWSTQFRWLTPSATDAYVANTTAIGPIYVGRFGGANLDPGWVGSDRFGYVWANGDGVWFYSSSHGWLGVTPTGGIWSVREERFL